MAPKRQKSGGRSAGSKEKGKKTASTPQEIPGHPSDIFPMVLTSATQGLFSCVAEEDVTGENPYKLLKKDDIIQDMKRRAAVSDFSPVKQIVLDYPEDELLLVYDRDFTYNQCFYLVLTPEAKERILKPPEPPADELSENEVSKATGPKPWICLGSDLEIDEESIKETRPKLRFKFSRVRREFGQPVCFSDRNTADARDGYIECASYRDSRFSIKQMQRDSGIQAVSTLQSSSAQTQWKFQSNTGIQYEPRELSSKQKEEILQSERLKDFCNKAAPWVLHACQQENLMSMHDWKTLETAEDSSSKVDEGLMPDQAFADQKYTKDSKVSCINWHPTVNGVVAVALSKDKGPAISLSPSLILFYSLSDPTHPQLLLECPDDILAFEFCPSDPNIIVGGCINGQVVLWDVSAHVTRLVGTQPDGKNVPVITDIFDLDDSKEKETPMVFFCAASDLDSSHKGPVTDVHWLPPTFEVTRTGLPLENQYNICVQFVTCAPGCSVMFWDLRPQKPLNQPAPDKRPNSDERTQRLPSIGSEAFKHLDRTWKPLFQLSLPMINTTGDYSPFKFCLDHYTCNSNDSEKDEEKDAHVDVIPEYSQLQVASSRTLPTLEDVNTTLIIGTEDDEIVYIDWKMCKDESGRLQSNKPLYCHNVHHMYVNTMQRSPFFKDIILTVGGLNFTIWSEETMAGPLFCSTSSEVECSVGCWSPSRPAIFFIGKGDGSVEVWNLLKLNYGPAQINAHVANGKITCMKAVTASPKQHFLAVAEQALVRVLEIPKHLCTPSRSEKTTVKKFFELEREKVQIILKRQELWMNEPKGDLVSEWMDAHISITLPRETDEKTEQRYKDFLSLEETVLKELGLWSAPTEDDAKCL